MRGLQFCAYEVSDRGSPVGGQVASSAEEMVGDAPAEHPRGSGKQDGV